jgi:hypothetical protein
VPPLEAFEDLGGCWHRKPERPDPDFLLPAVVSPLPATTPASGPAFPASRTLSAEVVTLSDALRRLSIASMERAAERFPACFGLTFDTSPVSSRAAATEGSLLLVAAWLCNSLMPVFCTDWKASASPQPSSYLSVRYDYTGLPALMYSPIHLHVTPPPLSNPHHICLALH